MVIRYSFESNLVHISTLLDEANLRLDEQDQEHLFKIVHGIHPIDEFLD